MIQRLSPRGSRFYLGLVVIDEHGFWRLRPEPVRRNKQTQLFFATSPYIIKGTGETTPILECSTIMLSEAATSLL